MVAPGVGVALRDVGFTAEADDVVQEDVSLPGSEVGIGESLDGTLKAELPADHLEGERGGGGRGGGERAKISFWPKTMDYNSPVWVCVTV